MRESRIISAKMEPKGIQDLAGRFVEAFLPEEPAQAFGLERRDTEIFRMFPGSFQKIQKFFVRLGLVSGKRWTSRNLLTTSGTARRKSRT